MFKCAILFVFIALANCEERPREYKTQYIDPFTMLDRHLSHSLAYHYLWPWNQLIRAATSLDVEEALEDPQIISNSDEYQVNMSVGRFKPEELKIKVKNRYIIVEGKHKETDEEKKYLANHFVQRFVLPPGTNQEEVTAKLNEKGLLSITAPKHPLPPPVPEREVPIEVKSPEEKTDKTTEKVDEVKETTPSVTTSSAKPLEKIEVEATTHVGKIRKKELKTTTKTTKDNEVTKGIDGNGLDYALIENEE